MKPVEREHVPRRILQQVKHYMAACGIYNGLLLTAHRHWKKAVFFSGGGLLFFLLAVCPPFPVLGMSCDLGIELSETVIAQTHLLDRYEYDFSYDETVNYVGLAPWAALDFNGRVTAFLRCDSLWGHYFTGDVNRGYTTGEDNDDWILKISDAYLDYKGEKISARAGQQPVSWGSGFILSDNVPGISLSYTHQRFTTELNGALVFDRSAMAGMIFGYRLGLFEKIDLFAIWFEDRDRSFEEALFPLLVEYYEEKSGTLTWYGAGLTKFVGNIYLKLTGAYESGHIELASSLKSMDMDVSAYFLDAGLEYGVTTRLSVGAFMFLASGDSRPGTGAMSVFLSPLPYNYRATIFFSPDFMARDDENSLVVGGNTAAGVVAPGLQVTAQASPKVLLTGRWIGFFAHDPPPDRSSWLGWELDTELTCNLTDTYLLYAEAAVFCHGSYLADTPSPAVKLVMGARLQF